MRRDAANRRHRAPLALAVAALLLLASCGSGGTPADDQAVDEQLGFDQAGLLERQAKVENAVRDCMKAQGFEYVPVDPVARQTSLVGAPGMSEQEFEKQFGYGITTLYERRRQQAAGGPNQAIRDRFSPAEQAAYDRALVGDNLDATFADAVDTGDFTRLGGCTRSATEQVFGGAEVLRTVQSKLDDLDARILADPRMVKAVGAWSGCMRAKGFDLANPDQVDVVLKRKLVAIVGPGAAASSAAIAGAGAVQVPYDQAVLADLGREEVAIVGADLACEKQHITDVEEAVRTEYERAFREQNTGLISKVPPP